MHGQTRAQLTRMQYTARPAKALQNFRFDVKNHRASACALMGIHVLSTCHTPRPGRSLFTFYHSSHHTVTLKNFRLMTKSKLIGTPSSIGCTRYKGPITGHVTCNSQSCSGRAARLVAPSARRVVDGWRVVASPSAGWCELPGKTVLAALVRTGRTVALS